MIGLFHVYFHKLGYIFILSVIMLYIWITQWNYGIRLIYPKKGKLDTRDTLHDLDV